MPNSTKLVSVKADCVSIGSVLLETYIFIIVFSLGKASASENLRGVGGDLLFEDGLNEGFQRFVFKASSGESFVPFDTGLLFYYSLESLSPDKKKSVVQFSGNGVLEDAAGGLVEGRSSYMCAFIRMTDGCIVQVAEGEVCGGSWSDSGDWVTSTYVDGKHFFEGGPSVTEIYKQYMKKTRSWAVGRGFTPSCKRGPLSKIFLLAILCKIITKMAILTCLKPCKMMGI